MQKATVEMTLDNFEEIINNNDIVLIDFWAEWCGPCRMFGPIFERVARKHPDIVFAKVNTEEQRTLAAMFGITSIPTLAIFREGILVFMQPGLLPERILEQLIEQVRNLDMDEVRRKVEEHERKHKEDNSGVAIS